MSTPDFNPASTSYSRHKLVYHAGKGEGSPKFYRRRVSQVAVSSLKAEAAAVACVGDGEQCEEVPADAEDGVERVEGDGDGDEARLVLDARVAVGRGVGAHAEVAVLEDARGVAHGDHGLGRRHQEGRRRS